MDDNLKIIERIKNGDNDAFSELLDNHRNLIYSIINNFDLQYSAFRIDKADLFQEGSLALYEAVDSYENNKQTKFSTYAYLVIRSKLINYLTKLSRVYSKEFVSIDSITHQERYRHLAVNDAPFLYHRKNELRKGLGRFMHSLSLEDRLIVEMRSRNCSYKEIAKKLNINTKRVDNRLNCIRKNLKSFLCESELI